MSKNRKIILLFAFISLLICIGTTASTYAKYFSVKEGKIGSQIKVWDIKINNENIKNGQILQKKINATIEPNKNIAENKIAPGSKGQFTIVIDYTNVELSFNYQLSMGENDNLKDLKIYKLEVDGQEITANNGAEINDNVIVSPTDTNKVKTINVFIEWNDDETTGATMDNEADTQIPINYDNIEFDVKIILTQIQ